MKNSNPAFKKNTFNINIHDGANMTYNGTILKTSALLLLVILSGAFTWGSPNAMGWVIGGAIAGLVLALITIFSPKTSMYTAPLYAIAQGLFLGAISSVFEAGYSGIVMQAILATMGVFILMLVLYQNKIIQATPKFQKIMMFALGAVMLTYVIGFIVSLFGTNLAIFGNGLIGIGFSIVVSGVAAFMLILDFHRIEQGVKQHAPKYMEWYGSFGLLVTLVWLYLELLRLLSKLQGD